MKFYFPPMNKLGNQAFRSLILDYEVDFVFTEMIRIDKLLDNDEVQIRKAKVEQSQIKQTVFQILAEDISLISKGVKKLQELNPELIEINYNMGCPQSSLCKNFNGGGILKNPDKIKEVAVKLFNICKKLNITPSIKTRLGVNRSDISIYDNLKLFEKIGFKKIYIHGRTLDDGYVKSATYSEIQKCIEEFPNLEIIFNGDIVGSQSFNNAIQTKTNGVAIGRAALENPKIFYYLKNNINFEFNKSGENIKKRQDIILKYLKYAKQYDLNNSYTKANLSYLTKGCIGASEYRKEINNLNNIDNIIELSEKL